MCQIVIKNNIECIGQPTLFKGPFQHTSQITLTPNSQINIRCLTIIPSSARPKKFDPTNIVTMLI